MQVRVWVRICRVCVRGSNGTFSSYHQLRAEWPHRELDNRYLQQTRRQHERRRPSKQKLFTQKKREEIIFSPNGLNNKVLVCSLERREDTILFIRDMPMCCPSKPFLFFTDNLCLLLVKSSRKCFAGCQSESIL